MFSWSSVFCCCTFTLHNLQGEMEDKASLLRERASERGHVHGWGGSAGRMRSRWRRLHPISTTEGELKMATGPPHINSIQGDTLSSNQHNAVFNNIQQSPFSPYLITLYWRCWINHLGTYSLTLKSRVEPVTFRQKMESRWENIFLKMRQNKFRFKMTGCDLPDVPHGCLQMMLWCVRAACLGDNLQHLPVPHLSSQCEENVLNRC